MNKRSGQLLVVLAIVPVQFEIAPALRIGAKEDAQAQGRARENEGNFAGHSVALV